MTSQTINSMPVLSSGSHRDPSQGACFMEYTSVLAGLPFDANVACTDGHLGALMIWINDLLPKGDRQELVPLLGRCIGLVAESPVDAKQLGETAKSILAAKLGCPQGQGPIVAMVHYYLVVRYGDEVLCSCGLCAPSGRPYYRTAEMVRIATLAHEAYEEAMEKLGMPNRWCNVEGVVEQPQYVPETPMKLVGAFDGKPVYLHKSVFGSVIGSADAVTADGKITVKLTSSAV